jgi:hypothetical protein
MKWAFLAGAILATSVALLSGCGGGADEGATGAGKSTGSAAINNNDPRAATAKAADTGPTPGQLMKQMGRAGSKQGGVAPH